VLVSEVIRGTTHLSPQDGCGGCEPRLGKKKKKRCKHDGINNKGAHEPDMAHKGHRLDP